MFKDTVDKVYMLSRYEDVLWGFTQTQVLSNRVYARTVGKVFGPSMLQMDGHDHIQRRKIVAPQFMGNRLGSFTEMIEDAAAEIVANTADKEQFDIVSEISYRLPATVMATLLGLPHEDLGKFNTWYNAMMAGFWTDAELRRRGNEAHLQFQDYLAPIVKERAQNPGEDLISRLLHAKVDDEQLSEVDVSSFMSLLLTAGGETTDKAISNLWWLLLTHPDEYRACWDDPSRLDLVFSETMRMFPSLLYLGREALEPLERHGVTIPAGSVVRLAVGSANRDERIFSEPDRFWPDRPDLHRGKELRTAQLIDGRSGHLAFGAGAHFCIGYELARTETLAVSRLLLKRLGPNPRLLSAARPQARPPAWLLDTLLVEAS